jgi:hypothetical protein
VAAANSSRASGHPEDVGVGWEERGPAKGEPLTGLDLKSGSLDTAGCVACLDRGLNTDAFEQAWKMGAQLAWLGQLSQ